MIISLVATTSVLAQNLIKTATAPVCFSKRDFVDTIKIKVIVSQSVRHIVSKT